LDNNEDWKLMVPTALVTVRPIDGGSTFLLQLTNTITLQATNMTSSPYGDREVRALVNYTREDGTGKEHMNSIGRAHVNWIDSIRTKAPVPTLGTAELNDAEYGNDPVEIISDWVTIAEDGYLTLRLRTQWGTPGSVHYINLLTGTDPENPYKLELRHDANGDGCYRTGDALVAFNLNSLPRAEGSEVPITLTWQSFSGPKSAEFDLYLRPTTRTDHFPEQMRMFNRYVK
jgi:hypothetical protein